MIPTTKAKQRDFLDTLIATLANGGMDKPTLLRHLRVLRRQLHNRSGIRGRRSAPPTHTQRAKILHLHRTTDMSDQEISHKLHISIGRVSEIIVGKRR